MPRGGQPGNKNASKAKVWTAAIERALEKRTRSEQKEALDELAEKLLVQCESGNLQALQELGNRLEGKPTQHVDHSGQVNQTHTVIAVQHTDSWATGLFSDPAVAASEESLTH